MLFCLEVYQALNLKKLNKNMDIDLNDFDKTLFIFNGEKKRNITPHKYMPKEYLTVGSEFYYFDGEFNCVRLIKITYIRSEVCFYTIEDEKHSNEYWFPSGSFFAVTLESKKYITNLNTDYYDVVTRWGKSEIIYAKDNEEKSWIKPYIETENKL
jgi:hypothetical protein